jgi:hypothetical protein
MKLLVFAHRGEAQAFLNTYDFVPVEFYFTGLFKSNNYFLLITGEGTKDSSEKTIAVLSSFRVQITEVINIGIAGSLAPHIKIGTLIWVRSSYAQVSTRPEFKSYTFNYHTKTDCITTNSRVTSSEERIKLSSFADIVDRELWSIASAGHLFKVDTLALKLISDNSDNLEICQLVKSEAPLLSLKLLGEFQNYEALMQNKMPKNLEVESSLIQDFFLNHPKLYFTTSQTRKLISVIRGFTLKKIITNEELIKLSNQIIENNVNDKTSKEISKILLQLFSEMLNPINAQIKEKINTTVKPLIDSGAVVSYDLDLEQEYIQINYQMRSSKDQKKLMLALEHFSYQKIKDIFSGKTEDAF